MSEIIWSGRNGSTELQVKDIAGVTMFYIDSEDFCHAADFIPTQEQLEELYKKLGEKLYPPTLCGDAGGCGATLETQYDKRVHQCIFKTTCSEFHKHMCRCSMEWCLHFDIDTNEHKIYFEGIVRQQ